MTEYVFFADSNCDLPLEMYKKYDIHVMNMPFFIDEVEYFDDGNSFVAQDFYALMARGVMPTTTLINPNRFEEAFEPHLAAGKDVFYSAFASVTSGTYNSALIAKVALEERYPERKVYVVDSCAQSGAEGMIAIAAAKEKMAGASAVELVDFIEQNRGSYISLFTVDDLGHLYRGGRVSRTSAIAGKALSIKPVMYTAPSGTLTVGAKARGRKPSLQMIVDKMSLVAINPDEQEMFIHHADCLADAEYMVDLIHLKYPNTKITILPLGPSVGAHVGPGCISLFFVGSTREWQK